MMMEIQNNEINLSGLTYSQASTDIYDQYKKNRDAELFEELVSDLIMNKYSDCKETNDFILSLDKKDQRLAIMSLIDKETRGDANLLWAEMKAYVDSRIDKMDHVKDVIRIINKFVKDGAIEKKNFGEIMTSIPLVREILATLPVDVWSNPNLKWLDPANGSGNFPFVVIYKLMNGLKDWEPDVEKRYKHIIENMIYTCELQSRNVFLWLCGVDPYNEYTTNTHWGSFLDEGFDKHMKEVWGVEKFDIVIANPPYLKSLHVDFLDKSLNLSDKIIFIHPSPWLFRGESISKNDNNRISSVRLINGNYYFKNAEFGAPLTITYITEKTTNSINLIFDTTGNSFKIKKLPTGFWEPNQIMNSLFEKFKKLSVNRNLSDLLYKNDGSGLIITAPRICGHAVSRNKKDKFVTNDFYTLFYRNSNLANRNSKNKVFKTSSIEERENLIHYMKSKICRFGLYINKLSQDSHINKYLSMIPVPSLDKKYTDIELCEIFSITSEEWNYIQEQISDYYI